MLYAKSTGGFYATEINRKNVPPDAVEISQEEHATLLSGQSTGKIIVSDNNGRPILTSSPGPDYTWNGLEWAYDAIRQKKRIIDLMQAHMDAKAQSYGYDHILSAASYATSSNMTWKMEGAAFMQWRDDVWSFGLRLLDDVASGKNTIKTDAELIAALPVFPLD